MAPKLADANGIMLPASVAAKFAFASGSGGAPRV